jgi:hypothetical protein
VGLEELSVFAPVALAGLRTLPDTLASRSIFIHMRRRAPSETLDEFRIRYIGPQGEALKKSLNARCRSLATKLANAEPVMPAGVRDRSAECWEPLLALADEAGGDWPARAREAALHLIKNAADETQSRGVELLEHIREAFGQEDRLSTADLIRRLVDRPESPWKDLRGKDRDLDDRGLALRLKGFGIKSKNVRVRDVVLRGYALEDFADAWSRYLSATSATSATNLINKNNFVADVADVADREGSKPCPDSGGCPERLDPDISDIPIPPFLDRRTTSCFACGGEGCGWCRPEQTIESGERP